jgi:transglutaminase/protease-like cytokinesis protein 3
MGKAVGEEIVTISGESLEPSSAGRDPAHAWNAVRIEGDWYLVDVTWDSTHTYGAQHQLGPMSIFLFMPPQQFLETHFPADPAWQLMDPPLSRGEALRLPKTQPPL